jgi:hypothetical protein
MTVASFRRIDDPRKLRLGPGIARHVKTALTTILGKGLRNARSHGGGFRSVTLLSKNKRQTTGFDQFRRAACGTR